MRQELSGLSRSRVITSIQILKTRYSSKLFPNWVSDISVNVGMAWRIVFIMEKRRRRIRPEECPHVRWIFRNI